MQTQFAGESLAASRVEDKIDVKPAAQVGSWDLAPDLSGRGVMMKRPNCGKHIQEKHFGAVTTAPLCGLVLAGGEGERLRPFVRRLRGDALPKQYVNFSGSRSMIDHTHRRAETLIPRARLFTIINQAHLNFAEVKHQLRGSSKREGPDCRAFYTL